MFSLGRCFGGALRENVVLSLLTLGQDGDGCLLLLVEYALGVNEGDGLLGENLSSPPPTHTHTSVLELCLCEVF